MTLITTSGNCIKYVLFAFNFCFVITGIILISVGVTVATVYDEYNLFLTDNFTSVCTFLVTIGAFIFFIAFFGCCGAIKENYCMTLTFSILLILIFVLELAAGISGYVLRNQTSDLIRNRLDESMKHYGNVSYRAETKLWDIIQSSFECCGIDNYKDWDKFHKEAVPVSCCSPETGAINSTVCAANESDNHRLYTNGCLGTFSDFISEHAVSLGGAGIAIAIIQFVGIFFACYVAREIKIKYGGSVF